jgi:hypothetical protein
MEAEEAHEKGRLGVMWAKYHLWQILGKDTIDLPFTVYDHKSKLTFNYIDGKSQFSFDLGGNLRRPNSELVGGLDVVEVFVEVKYYNNSADLLKHYKDFLQKAAIVSLQPQHLDTLFIFYATVPFGCSHGVELCNGKLFSKCRTSWSKPLNECSEDLYDRIIILISTSSFQRLLKKWGRER